MKNLPLGDLNKKVRNCVSRPSEHGHWKYNDDACLDDTTDLHHSVAVVVVVGAVRSA